MMHIQDKAATAVLHAFTRLDSTMAGNESVFFRLFDGVLACPFLV